MARVKSGRPRSTRGRILAILALLLFVMPLLEISVIIAVGQVIGMWPTIILLVLESAFGAWLVRREGGQAWTALATALRTGRMPSRELSDAALILVGGALLLTPGFVTDLVGFLVVAPPTRPLARRVLERLVAERLLAGVVPSASTGWEDPPAWNGPGRPMGQPGAGPTVRGDVVD
jgi:UPF0716 protein FxsA